jgi:hypothetical protein
MNGSTVNKQRTDITEYLIHWTSKSRFSSIIETGLLVADWGVRTVSEEEACRTISGDRPAVCFGEVPVGNYLQSSLALPNRYSR